MINITVNLHAILSSLASQGAQGPFSLSLPDHAVAGDVLPALGLPKMEVVFSLNSQIVDKGASLQDGDRLDIIPAISGGQAGQPVDPLQKVVKQSRRYFLDEVTSYGCAETVFMVLKDAYGLPDPDDSSPAMALNGGLANSGGPCGALSGAALAVGMLAGRRIVDHNQAKRVARRLIIRLMDQFHETFSATDCRDLIGVDLRDEQAHRRFIESGAWRIGCMRQVEFVVQSLFDLAGEADWKKAVGD